MKHVRALLCAPVLSVALVASGVAAWASDPLGDVAPGGEAGDTAALAPDASAFGVLWRQTAPQEVVPGVFLTARRASHGTRSDRQFFEISTTGSNDVPVSALRAYRHAERVMAVQDPGCHISWTLLAAIGRVESDHGRFGGAELGVDGVSRPEIVGPQLNGAGAFAAIHDTDHGALDHDPVWDRAVGQMQFLPETWRSVARDGDGDGRLNPDDIDDSALGAAVYLCGAGGSLADAAGAGRAAFRYNHSDYYVQLVLSFQAGYVTGVFSAPTPPPSPPAPAGPTKVRKAPARPRHASEPRSPKPRPAPRPSATPRPTPKPAPQTPQTTPQTTPSGPNLVRADGTWSSCAGGHFCLGATSLDLGPDTRLGDRAGADFDHDGTVETNSEEFTGLVGQHVSLQVERNALGLVVYVIDGNGLRNADGSFARTGAPASLAAPATGTP